MIGAPLPSPDKAPFRNPLRTPRFPFRKPRRDGWRDASSVPLCHQSGSRAECPTKWDLSGSVALPHDLGFSGLLVTSCVRCDGQPRSPSGLQWVHSGGTVVKVGLCATAAPVGVRTQSHHAATDSALGARQRSHRAWKGVIVILTVMSIHERPPCNS